MKPQPHEIPDYFKGYVALVKEDQLLEALTSTSSQLLSFIKSLPEAMGDHAYTPGKWTIKEVLLHCMDTERIFSTRAMGYARGERQKSLSYDENHYAPNSEAGLRSLASIYEEYEAISRSTYCLFKSFSPNKLSVIGETPAGKSTVNGMGFVICGHSLHHLNILNERYLSQK